MNRQNQQQIDIGNLTEDEARQMLILYVEREGAQNALARLDQQQEKLVQSVRARLSSLAQAQA